MAQSSSTREIASASSVDKILYSQQLYLTGDEAMRMASVEVLICGATDLGIQIAKYIIKGGVKNLTLHDVDNCEIKDISSKHYLTSIDVKRNRAEVSSDYLKELYTSVDVHGHSGILSEDFLKKFEIIVLTNSPLEEQCHIGELAHNNNIALIVADSKGLFGQIFCDFGEDFTVLDVKGEQPLSVKIASISKEKDCIVRCSEGIKHGFVEGDYVTFSEIQGMAELNGCEPRKVQVFDPYTFGVGDTTELSDYINGGIATQVNMPRKIHFKCFKDSIEEPEIISSDLAKADRPPQLHIAFKAMHMFWQKHKRFSKPLNEIDATGLLGFAKELNLQSKNPVELNSDLIKTFSSTLTGDVHKLNVVIGSITAQEVMKVITRKFLPIRQWMYIDASEHFPEWGLQSKKLAQPVGSHCDRNVDLKKNNFPKMLADLKYSCTYLPIEDADKSPPGIEANASVGLSPVAFFWDVENVPIPKENIQKFATNLRSKFLESCHEADFFAIFNLEDITRKMLIPAIAQANITLVHCQSTQHNAADYLLKDRIIRFVDSYKYGTIVLISNDGGFKQDIAVYLKFGVKFILIHGKAPSKKLQQISYEHYDANDFAEVERKGIKRKNRKRKSRAGKQAKTRIQEPTDTEGVAGPSRPSRNSSSFNESVPETDDSD